MVVIYKLSCTVQEVIDDDHESVEDLKHNEDEQTDDKITDCCFLPQVAYDQQQQQ